MKETHSFLYSAHPPKEGKSVVRSHLCIQQGHSIRIFEQAFRVSFTASLPDVCNFRWRVINVSTVTWLYCIHYGISCSFTVLFLAYRLCYKHLSASVTTFPLFFDTNPTRVHDFSWIRVIIVCIQNSIFPLLQINVLLTLKYAYQLNYQVAEEYLVCGPTLPRGDPRLTPQWESWAMCTS